MLPGDILVFKKGNSLVTRLLSWLLQKFEPDYDGWGWHTAMVVMFRNPIDPVYYIVHSVDKGVSIAPLDDVPGEYRVYRWFTDTPTDKEVWLAANSLIGKPYDIDAYFGTIVAYIWHKLTGKSWRVIDDEFHCWELTFWLCRLLGEPIQPMNKYPILSELLKHYGKRPLDGIYRRLS